MIVSNPLEKHKEGMRASVKARQESPFREDLWNLDPVQRMGWNQFLAHLAKLHGPEYLCNPEGETLALVSPDGIPQGYAVPINEYKPPRVKRRAHPRTLPDYYTGNPQQDLHRERPIPEGLPLDMVRDVLLDSPATSTEISKQTGLTVRQVVNVFSHHPEKFEKTETKRGQHIIWRIKRGSKYEKTTA